MDSINSAPFSNNSSSVRPAFSGEAKDSGASEPHDCFTTGDSEKGAIGDHSLNFLVKALNIRIPTTTPIFPDIERIKDNKVLNALKPGDIFFETDDAYPLWQILEKTALKADYTHAAIYEGNGKFLEATACEGKGVTRSDMKEYLNNRIYIKIIRPDYKTPEDVKAALDYAREQIGKPYDSAFHLDTDDKYYCFELVKKSLESMPNPIKIPTTTFLGREVVGPNQIEEGLGKNVLYEQDHTFFKSMLSHYPVAAAAAAGAAAGALALGPVGAVAGFAGAGALAILIGNKIQTGTTKFSY